MILSRGTAPDPDIPKGVAGAHWYEGSKFWWNTVERLSWTMLVHDQGILTEMPFYLERDFDLLYLHHTRAYGR